MIHRSHSRILMTGAAGGLGQAMRIRLKANCDTLRLSDLSPLGSAQVGEELVQADLADAAAVSALVEGCQAIVHFGGVSTEQPWGAILQANILGAYNLYEAARVHGAKRVVFASSNHVMGFYRQNEVVDALSPPRPDGLYGLSKALAKTLRACTLTATALRRPVCALVLRLPNRVTGACWPPGSALTICTA